MTLISRNTKNQKVGTILKFSSKIIETGKINTPKTQIQRSLSWVSTGTSILLSLFLTFLA